MSSSILLLIALAAGGYILGGIPFGYLVGRLFSGVDIRDHGSMNVGATNVVRVVGLKPGLLVLALDMLKGLLPALLARQLAGLLDPPPSPQVAAIITGTAAILGHTFTIFLRFRGGKGVATAAGVCLAVIPLPTVMALATFTVVLAIWRFVSLGSIVAAIALVVSTFLLGRGTSGVAEIVFACAVAALIIVRHHANIRRLFGGTENHFSFSSRKPPAG